MLKLIVESKGEQKEVDFEVNKLVNAGRSGRDAEAVKKHMEELRKSGINVGHEFPIFWPKTPDRVTTSIKFEVLPKTVSSGEVEFVLLVDKDTIYVGVGSDHTDRGVQKTNLVAAKEIYYNVLSPKVWIYEEVKEYWDELVMRSWVKEDGKRQLYQEGKLVEILKPEKILEEVKLRVGNNLNGLIVFSGTFPTLSGKLSYSSYFEVELRDDRAGRMIHHIYQAEPISWFKR